VGRHQGAPAKRLALGVAIQHQMERGEVVRWPQQGAEELG
jgi:hypothetical protein